MHRHRQEQRQQQDARLPKSFEIAAAHCSIPRTPVIRSPGTTEKLDRRSGASYGRSR
jgi:hypothetical protein